MERLLSETVEIISAHIANNAVPASELPDLIKAVHRSLIEISDVPKIDVLEEPKFEPAVPVKKSVHRDFIYSLENGKKFSSLTRHLSALGLSPDQYRAKWKLPADYPMNAAAYSEKRSALAKSLGLGRKAAFEIIEAQAKPRRSRAKAKDQPTVGSAPENVETNEGQVQPGLLASKQHNKSTPASFAISEDGAQDAARAPLAAKG